MKNSKILIIPEGQDFMFGIHSGAILFWYNGSKEPGVIKPVITMRTAAPITEFSITQVKKRLTKRRAPKK